MASIGWKLRQLIRANRRNVFVKTVALGAEKYLRAWHNDHFWEFEFNGERRVIDAYAKWIGDRPVVVWDVGAHEGEWAREAHRLIGKASIHSFEILKPTFDNLAAKLGQEDWSIIRNLGLSDQPGTIPVVWNSTWSQTSSIMPRLDNRFFVGSELETLNCEVTTADTLVANGVPAPDLLKIDVEGHEVSVIRGARTLLDSPHAPALIQFEYGDTWLPESATLRVMHSILTTAGYQVGRIYPDHVDFAIYKSIDDNFRMGNFVAVKDDALASALRD